VTDWLDGITRQLGELEPGETFHVDASAARAGGMSHINLLATGSRGTRFIVRVPPDSGPLEPYDIEAEVRQIRRAEAAGIPVAHPVAVRPTFAVMEFVDGPVLVPGGEWSEPERAALARELVTMLARIHAIPGEAEPELTPAPLLLRWTAALGEVGGPDMPVLPAYAAVWLRRHIPRPTRCALVHGDYRLGNMIWQGTTIRAVLDWEYSAPGDPLFDLAWLLMGTTHPDDLVMGLMRRDEVLRLYRTVSGLDFTVAQLRWWEVLVAWMRVVIEVKGIRLNQAARLPDLRSLLWEFGHGSAYRHILTTIRLAEEAA
jgi:aminoglycoside phosphotransferase (APT) family kinase protein